MYAQTCARRAPAAAWAEKMRIGYMERTIVLCCPCMPEEALRAISDGAMHEREHIRPVGGKEGEPGCVWLQQMPDPDDLLSRESFLPVVRICARKNGTSCSVEMRFGLTALVRRVVYAMSAFLMLCQALLLALAWPIPAAGFIPLFMLAILHGIAFAGSRLGVRDMLHVLRGALPE